MSPDARIVPQSRLRTRECMHDALKGDFQVLPMMVLCIYQHIVSSGTQDAQQCLGRAAEVLQDLAELVQASEHATAQLDRRVAQESAPQLAVHVSIFALGAALHFVELRPAVAWCAAHFFVLRAYEMLQCLGRVVIPPAQFLSGVDKLKWTLALIFFCLDCPTGSHPTRLFSGFATGVLLYRTLFLRETRTSKVLHCVAAVLEVVRPSIATYTLLALRLLHARS